MSYNPGNERIKHRYFAYLRKARKLGEGSIDRAALALDRFETYSGRKPFKDFDRDSAIAFKTAFPNHINARTGERFSKAVVCSTLGSLYAFFFWLSGLPGFRSLRYADVKHFKLSERSIE